MEIDQRPSWMDPFIAFLTSGKFPEGDIDKRRFRYKSAYYSLHAGGLYRKTLSGLLARCVSEEEAPRVLEEIHSGECGSHSGSRTLEGRVLGIDLRFVSVHHPRSNGQVEAANKVIVNLLKKKVDNLRGNLRGPSATNCTKSPD